MTIYRITVNENLAQYPLKSFFYRKSFIGKRMLQTQSRGKIEEENLGQLHFGRSVLVISLGR